jgi:ABC-type phosphate transport system substrate-binding protein
MKYIYRLAFNVLFLGICFHLSANAQDISLVVVANNKGAPSEMKSAQLKSIMKGEKLRWPDGSKVVIALLKSTTSIGTATSKKIYNMSSNELNKYWLALVFQGKADAPNFFNSEGELEEFVSQTNGAIGIVSHPSASNKVITIDGQKAL